MCSWKVQNNRKVKIINPVISINPSGRQKARKRYLGNELLKATEMGKELNETEIFEPKDYLDVLELLNNGYMKEIYDQ